MSDIQFLFYIKIDIQFGRVNNTVDIFMQNHINSLIQGVHKTIKNGKAPQISMYSMKIILQW